MSESSEDKQTSPSQVETMSIIEVVRQRPGMYIGSTDYHGLHWMLWDVIVYGLNQHLAGVADHIAIRLSADGSVSVEDNGPGMVVDAVSGTKSVLERALTELTSQKKGSHPIGYQVVPDFLFDDMVFVANALSSRLVAEVKRDGYLWHQEYERGVPQTDAVRLQHTVGAGTKFILWPDVTIFKDARVDRDFLLEKMQMTCYLNPRLNVQIIDGRSEQEHVYDFRFPDGVRSYVRSLTGIRDAVHEPIVVSTTISTTRIDIALQYNSDDMTNVLTFANNYFTPDGGAHLIGFYLALIRVLNDQNRMADPPNKKDTSYDELPVLQDVRRGLCAIISTWLVKSQFENATKERLYNPEVKEQVAIAMTEGLMRHFEQMPQDLDRIIRHLTGGSPIQRHTTPLTRDEQAAWDEFQSTASAET